jgi:uncharacterized Zn-finger protein
LPFPCEFCPRSFPNEGQKWHHELIHRNGIYLLCPYCDKRCNYKCNLKSHVRTYHKVEYPNYKDSMVTYTKDNEDKSISHAGRVVKGPSYNSYGARNWRNANGRGYRQVLPEYLPRVRKPKMRKFECFFCKKKSTKDSERTKHMLRRHIEKCNDLFSEMKVNDSLSNSTTAVPTSQFPDGTSFLTSSITDLK